MNKIIMYNLQVHIMSSSKKQIMMKHFEIKFFSRQITKSKCSCQRRSNREKNVQHHLLFHREWWWWHEMNSEFWTNPSILFSRIYTLNIVFQQISTFLEYSGRVVYGPYSKVFIKATITEFYGFEIYNKYTKTMSKLCNR